MLLMCSLFAVLPGRPSRRWDNNIKMDLTEIGYEDVDLIWLRIAFNPPLAAL
jgi:hypothetical protein